MPFHEFTLNDDQFIIVTPNKSCEPAYRVRLSKYLLEKYGNEITNDSVIDVLLDCHEFFIDEFIQAMDMVNDLMFILFVFNLHEQTAKLSYLRSVDGIKIPLDQTYFAAYRRILKMILQQSCTIELTQNIHPSEKWMASSLEKIEELIFLGSFALNIADAVSEQKLTGASIQITFKDGLYVLGHPPEWDGFFNLFSEDFDDQIDGSIHDSSLPVRFDEVIKKEFQLDLTELGFILAGVAERLLNQEPPRFCMVSELVEVFRKETNSQHVEAFIDGLILSKNNVASLKSGILSPYKGNRLIHRPLLRIDIDNVPCLLFSQFTFLESINTLFQNQITHGKLPKEWQGIPPVKDIWKDLVAYHKDILENPVERLLKDKQIPHERNVKTLKSNNVHENLSINQTPGEIDFIFIHGTIIYLADCKNLTKHYEMHGYYQDASKFEPYINKMAEKVAFMKDNLERLQTHLRIMTKNDMLNINSFEIRGIFIINTPTLYSVNASFRIYSYYNFELLISGDDVFKDTVSVPDAEETQICWPYIDNYKKYLKATQSN